MPISAKAAQELQFLNDLDSNQYSVARKGGQFIKIDKRSAIHNFFSWVIYLISFTLVPRNRELDQISIEILQDFSDEISKATVQERELVEKAIRILNEVIESNGGSQGHIAAKLLATITKIQSLPEVQKLSGSPPKEKKEQSEPKASDGAKTDKEEHDRSESEDKFIRKEPKVILKPETPKEDPIPESPIADKLKLKQVLQNLLEKIKQIRATQSEKDEADTVHNPQELIKEFIQALPSLDDSEQLSEEEIQLLSEIFDFADSDYLSENLSPSLLSSLVKNSLSVSDFSFACTLLNRLTFNKQQLAAFVKSFEPAPSCLKQVDVFKGSNSKNALDFLWAVKSKSAIFKEYLTDKEIQPLVLTLIEGLLISQNLSVSYHFDQTLEFIGQFEMLKNDHGIVKALCQADPKFLIQIFAITDEIAFAAQTILEANPPKQAEPVDSFFTQFLKDLNYIPYSDAIHPKVAEAVFKNESPERQLLFFNSIIPDRIVPCLEHIPMQLLAGLDELKTSYVAFEVLNDYKSSPNDQKLQKFADSLTDEKIYHLAEQDDLLDFVIAILPLVDRDIRIQLARKVLENISSTEWKAQKARKCITEAGLDPTVWEEASRFDSDRVFSYNYEDFSDEMLQAIAHGQIGNSKFLKNLFQFIFGGGGVHDQREVRCTSMKPDAFIFDEPEDISPYTWCRFFRALRASAGQKNAQAVLISTTLHLFNSPGLNKEYKSHKYLYALTKEQMQLLPLMQYKNPTIRLLLAALTERLDDEMIDTANDLLNPYNLATQFFWHFEEAYINDKKETDDELEERGFAFKKDIRYLKNFLLWILDRPSIDPLLPAWTKISKNHAYTSIDRPEIQNDATIQALIAKARLQTKK